MNELKNISKLLVRKIGLIAGILVSIEWTPVVYAGIVGSDTQNFNGSLSAQDYATAESAQTLGTGKLSLGLFFNHATNTLPYFSEQAGQSSRDASQKYNDGMTGSSVVVSYGLTKRLDLGVAIDSVLYQDVRDDADHGQFRQEGIVGVRLYGKLRLLKSGVFALASTASGYFNTIKDNPYAQGRRPSYALELIPELDFNFVRVALNIGYRWRNGQGDSELPGEAVGLKATENQTIASLAVAVPVTKATQVVGEIYGARAGRERSGLTARKTTNSESLLGIKTQLTSSLSGQLGMGREIQHSLSSADLRGYVGIHWQVGVLPAPRRRLVAKPRPIIKQTVAEPEAVILEGPDRIEIISDIMFAYDSAAINSVVANQELGRIADLLRSSRGLKKMVIEGHTCSLGSDRYNLALSQKRAEAVMNYLADVYKIPRSKMEFRGYGESRPVASNATESERKRNRRVEFKIYHLSH